MKTMFKFRCPACDAGLKTSGEKAGTPFDCPRCQSPGTVPPAGALVPLPGAEVAPRRARPADRPKKSGGGVPVALRFPGRLGGLKAEVSRKTANTIATTTIGGVLVAIGVALAAMILGGKNRSA